MTVRAIVDMDSVALDDDIRRASGGVLLEDVPKKQQNSKIAAKNIC